LRLNRYPTLKYFQFLLQPPPDALFAHPRLFRACVPPGMHRFRGNIWDFDSRPKIMECLGYPRPMKDRVPEITEARNIELGLGLQVGTFILEISNKITTIIFFIYSSMRSYCSLMNSQMWNLPYEP
jgi:hypothetical protein